MKWICIFALILVVQKSSFAVDYESDGKTDYGVFEDEIHDDELTTIEQTKNWETSEVKYAVIVLSIFFP